MTELEYVRRCSQYFDILLRNNPSYVEWLSSENNLRRRYPLTGLYRDLQTMSRKADTFQDLLRIFRRFKQLHFLRIGSRDLLGYSDLPETTGQLSDLAAVSLQTGLEMLTLRPDWWTWGEELGTWERLGGAIPIAILGLGKLGGHELNYVSDIDLMIVYSGSDNEDPNSFVALPNRLGHWLSRLLSDRFEGDRVFQVDFRLRPQGKDGLLAPSIVAAVDHYLLRGQTWERQMLLKCRPVAGDRSVGTAFIREVRPFVYRRFLDFQAINELRDMRNRILTEAVRFRPDAGQFDVKLGIGGIREIEFLVQSLQLIYGGRHPELDEPNTLKCLEKIGSMGLIPNQTVLELKDSYIFLRNVEHYIQLDQNRQTQRLPRSEDALRRLVFAMRYREDGAEFLQELEGHCLRVHGSFSSLFHQRLDENGVELDDDKPLKSVGRPGKLESFPSKWTLRLRETLRSYPGSFSTAIMGALESFTDCNPDIQEKVLFRVDTYFGRVGRRPGLKKLFESPGSWLVPFCRAIGSSELFSSLLAHNPALVEGLALRHGIFNPFVEWESSSRLLLESAGDYDEKLEWIRRLKNERILQLVLADLGGEVDGASLEAEHTALAEFVIRNTFEAVRQKVDLSEDLPLSVLGMGRLGSREMSYLSDLDLVFVYAPKQDEAENQIPGPVIRLIQRFMNMLNTPLQEGPGYPVDARLRPTGSYGPLVVTKTSWLDYFQSRADIWEIQALLRCRHIAGDLTLGYWINEQAEKVCYQPRGNETVWPRICHLRDRMEKERSTETEGEIDLKLGIGGIADIEFLIQGLLLVYGHNDRETRFRSVRSAVEGFLPGIPGIIPGAQAIHLALQSLRALERRTRLHTNSTSGKLTERNFNIMSSLALWPPRLEAGSIETWTDVLRLKREVRGIFRQFCP